MIRYDDSGRPVRRVDRPANSGVGARCRRGHRVAATADRPTEILETGPTLPGGTFLPPASEKEWGQSGS